MVGPQGGRRRGPLLRQELRQGRLREGLQGVPGEARRQHPLEGRRAALPRDLVLRRGRRREVDRRHRGRERRRQRSHGRRGRRRRGDLRQLRLQGHRRPHDGRQTRGPGRVPPLVRRGLPHGRREAGHGLLRRRARARAGRRPGRLLGDEHAGGRRRGARRHQDGRRLRLPHLRARRRRRGRLRPVALRAAALRARRLGRQRGPAARRVRAVRGPRDGARRHARRRRRAPRLRAHVARVRRRRRHLLGRLVGSLLVVVGPPARRRRRAPLRRVGPDNAQTPPAPDPRGLARRRAARGRHVLRRRVADPELGRGAQIRRAALPRRTNRRRRTPRRRRVQERERPHKRGRGRPHGARLRLRRALLRVGPRRRHRRLHDGVSVHARVAGGGAVRGAGSDYRGHEERLRRLRVDDGALPHAGALERLADGRRRVHDLRVEIRARRHGRGL
mmetsp:Transcript_31090/g.102109  ORF Transcript_31090/g.102109 Transcript_31090/m.102109 type:complete len:446 (+) Transcript_31090:469-1806(+)